MLIRSLALLALSLGVAAPARGADTLIERLATCQESWLDAKDDPVKTRALGDTFNGAFTPAGNDGSYVPTTRTLVAGFPIVKAFPQSVGMGVGFSVVLDASFENALAAVQTLVGKSIKCETGDNMRACELQVAEKRTLTLMAPENNKVKQTLLGCYYFYAQ